jgi:hypothetical protein
MVDYRVGMILKNRVRNPVGILVITHMYQREYGDGELAARIVGLQIEVNDFQEDWLETRPHGMPTPGINGADLRDLDARSVERMYPYVMFNPIRDIREEDK